MKEPTAEFHSARAFPDHFAAAVAFTLAQEGGLSDHLADKGGLTKYGITLASLATFRGVTCLPTDVRALTLDQAKEVYYELYWKRPGLADSSQRPTAIALFDAGVLFGVKSAGRAAQRALNLGKYRLEVDGVLGKETMAALNDMHTALFVVGLRHELNQMITRIVKSTAGQVVFEIGWRARIQRYGDLLG